MRRRHNTTASAPANSGERRGTAESDYSPNKPTRDPCSASTGVGGAEREISANVPPVHYTWRLRLAGDKSFCHVSRGHTVAEASQARRSRQTSFRGYPPSRPTAMTVASTNVNVTRSRHSDDVGGDKSQRRAESQRNESVFRSTEYRQDDSIDKDVSIRTRYSQEDITGKDTVLRSTECRQGKQAVLENTGYRQEEITGKNTVFRNTGYKQEVSNQRKDSVFKSPGYRQEDITCKNSLLRSTECRQGKQAVFESAGYRDEDIIGRDAVSRKVDVLRSTGYRQGNTTGKNAVSRSTEYRKEDRIVEDVCIRTGYSQENDIDKDDVVRHNGYKQEDSVFGCIGYKTEDSPHNDSLFIPKIYKLEDKESVFRNKSYKQEANAHKDSVFGRTGYQPRDVHSGRSSTAIDQPKTVLVTHDVFNRRRDDELTTSTTQSESPVKKCVYTLNDLSASAIGERGGTKLINTPWDWRQYRHQQDSCDVDIPSLADDSPHETQLSPVTISSGYESDYLPSPTLSPESAPGNARDSYSSLTKTDDDANTGHYSVLDAYLCSHSSISSTKNPQPDNYPSLDSNKKVVSHTLSDTYPTSDSNAKFLNHTLSDPYPSSDSGAATFAGKRFSSLRRHPEKRRVTSSDVSNRNIDPLVLFSLRFELDARTAAKSHKQNHKLAKVARSMYEIIHDLRKQGSALKPKRQSLDSNSQCGCPGSACPRFSPLPMSTRSDACLHNDDDSEGYLKPRPLADDSHLTGDKHLVSDNCIANKNHVAGDIRITDDSRIVDDPSICMTGTADKKCVTDDSPVCISRVISDPPVSVSRAVGAPPVSVTRVTGDSRAINDQPICAPRFPTHSPLRSSCNKIFPFNNSHSSVNKDEPILDSKERLVRPGLVERSSVKMVESGAKGLSRNVLQEMTCNSQNGDSRLAMKCVRVRDPHSDSEHIYETIPGDENVVHVVANPENPKLAKWLTIPNLTGSTTNINLPPALPERRYNKGSATDISKCLPTPATDVSKLTSASRTELSKYQPNSTTQHISKSSPKSATDILKCQPAISTSSSLLLSSKDAAVKLHGGSKSSSTAASLCSLSELWESESDSTLYAKVCKLSKMSDDDSMTHLAVPLPIPVSDKKHDVVDDGLYAEVIRPEHVQSGLTSAPRGHMYLTDVSSENYCRLEPIQTADDIHDWSSGDILNYIDGIHDNKSPKRRENILQLLGNSSTCAKLSESLEIETRLLHKGLLLNAWDESDVVDMVPPSEPSSVFNMHLVQPSYV